jgi:hypothetical protein
MSDRAHPRGLVTLVPRSGIQFLDLDLAIEALPRTPSVFWEEMLPETAVEPGKSPVVLRVLEPDADGALSDPVTRQTPPESETYAIGRAQALEPFLRRWVPLPMFRVKGRGADGRVELDRGPTNWVRAHVAPAPEGARDGASHRLTIAFDTALLPREEGRGYLAPAPEDSARAQEFTLVADPRDNAWFVNEAWIGEWLEDAFLTAKSEARGRPVKPEDLAHACEHWARYLAFLRLLREAELVPRVRLLEMPGEGRGAPPIPVDLVLDVGNSRTCGLLVEENPGGEGPSLNNAVPLALRDLSRPETTHVRPFDSRVEFALASFGRDAVSRRSGRPNAFRWGSPVRVGPEALRLAAATRGNEGATGLSSPKRYLWDRRPNLQGWRFNGLASDGVTTEPPVSGPFMAFVSETGDVLRGARRGEPAVRARFSRSSLFTFMLAELLMQAAGQINSPSSRAARRFADVPRRLRRVILTLPPSMPLAEQRILRERAEGAVRLAWDLLGWSAAASAPGMPLPPPEPRVMLNLDEATATQIVWLYTETLQRLAGDAGGLFELIGRTRPGTGQGPSLRIASLDIGGGTTDLMIATWMVESRSAIIPRQEFRDGFKIAGDEVLEGLIAHAVLPGFAAALRAAGCADATAFLKQLLGGDRGGESEIERHLKRQFVQQVLEPAALAILHAYEKASPAEKGELIRRPVFAILGQEAQPANGRAIAHVEQAAARAGAAGFRVGDVVVAADAARVDAIVTATLGPILADLCEAVWHYDCDVLLLSGRPSRLRAVQDLVLAKLPVPAHRIIQMHRYPVGGWYPFRDAQARIEDPKTTAAVGAMLAALAEGRIENFLMRSSMLAMRSTAKIIGRMDISGQVRDQEVLLSGVDLEQPGEASFTMAFAAPCFLGFRQVPVERWPATPLYAVEFANPDTVPKLALPLRVKITRAEADPEAPDAEARREEFRIEEIVDAAGGQLRNSDVELRLQTMKTEAGYWRDTGRIGLA